MLLSLLFAAAAPAAAEPAALAPIGKVATGTAVETSGSHALDEGS